MRLAPRRLGTAFASACVLSFVSLACDASDRTAAPDTTVTAEASTSAPKPVSTDAATPVPAQVVDREQGSILVWSADFEEGTLADWYAPAPGADGNQGGGLFNSGEHEALVTTERARSGAYSLHALVRTEKGTSAVRAFRWGEARAYRQLLYSAWFFVPTNYRRTGEPETGAFWNLFQFKSRSASGRNDPVWALYVNARSDGLPYLRAGWGWGGTELAGPYESSQRGGKFFEQAVADLPIGRWFKLEALLRQSKDFDGKLTIWQDGSVLYEFSDVRTSYPHVTAGQSWGANNEWSVNNYSDGLVPSPASIYIDDAEIRR